MQQSQGKGFLKQWGHISPSVKLQVLYFDTTYDLNREKYKCKQENVASLWILKDLHTRTHTNTKKQRHHGNKARSEYIQ